MGGRWAVTAFGVALTLTLLGAVLRDRAAVSLSDESPRVVMIGIRGLSWPAVADLMQEGRMPRLARIAEGASSVADIVAPGFGSAGEIHASIITGKYPFKHGAHTFRELRDAGDAFPQTIWELLSEDRSEVAVIGFPAAAAPARIPSDPTPLWRVAPEEVPAESVARISGDTALSPPLSDALRRSLASDMSAIARACRAAQEPFTGHVFVYLEGLHLLEQALQSISPAAPSTDAPAVRYHEELDAMLGRLADLGDRRTTFVLFSERGAGAEILRQRPDLPHSGRRTSFGFFMAWGGAVKRGVIPLTIAPIDLTPTLLYIAGHPVPNDMDGVVLLGLLDDGLYHERPPIFAR